jgi:drug/metabolite transporter (DMT)-like permease
MQDESSIQGASGVGRNQDRKITPFGLANLIIVYIVWGGTYLAIRIAVRDGAGFPPFSLGLTRAVVAGSLLLLWGAVSGKRLRITRDEIAVLALSGLLFWTLGNGLVILAERHADSGLAALIIASTPIWTALIESLLDRRLPSQMLSVALLVGFAGIVLLGFPSLRDGTRSDTVAVLTLLVASISWAAASVWQGRRPLKLATQVSSGYMMLFGSVGLLALTLLTREPLPSPTPQAWVAWVYLVLFGSVIAFNAYMRTLQLLPISIAITTSYVNPVIAVVLGALILSESITFWTIAGAVLVLLGVAGVFRDRNVRIAETTAANSIEKKFQSSLGSD